MPKDTTHLYKLLYKIEKPPAGVLASDVPEGYGATDAILITSILYPKDGSLSVAFIGADGRADGELHDKKSVLDDAELFKVWTFLTKRLSESKTLPGGRRDFCQYVWDTFHEAMHKAIEQEKKNAH
jgi:hypothetical protein